MVLADEIPTPDSSRFWDLSKYEVGTKPASFGKQFVCDWLKDNNLVGDSSIKEIPADIIEKTASIYAECAEKICKES